MTIEEFESQLLAAAEKIVSEFDAKFPEFRLKIRTRDTECDALLIELLIGYRDGAGIDFLKERWAAQCAFFVYQEIPSCLESLRNFIRVWETRLPTAMSLPAD